MVTGKAVPKNLVEAVQQVFDALEPFDEDARQRIVSSAASLLGTAFQSSFGQGASHQARPQPVQAPPTAERRLSPIELIHQKQPATNQQRIALFAYYREKFEGLSRFSRDDLRAYFAKAKQPPPANFDRDYMLTVKAGWIYDDGDDSYLTSKGLEVVEAGFGGKASPRGVSAPKVKRPKAKGKKKA